MKIWKEYNKRTKRHEWRARFRLSKKTYRLKESTKDDLLDVIAEIRSQENKEQTNKKYNLNRETVSYIPALSEVFDDFLPTVAKDHQRKISKRVFETFLALLPPLIKINELTTAHFQLYLKHRAGHLGKQSKQPIKAQTIFKEIYAITAPLKQVRIDYDALAKWQIPELPKPPKGFKKKAQRQRLVTEKEFAAVINELTKLPKGREDAFHRTRLAHILEFGLATGLRRKEIARLRFAQYDADIQVLLNVRRWKTGTTAVELPLGKRAVEIIEARRVLQEDSEYIFSPDGEPIESNYRTLKQVCEKLKIPYGRFKEGGFVAHDLRHNFGTEILRESDIETARELLGHANISQTATYVHTSSERMREAVRKRDKIDYDWELKAMFAAIGKGEIKEAEFIEKIKKLFRF